MADVIIGALCFGALLGHLGSLPAHGKVSGSFVLGEAAMVIAVFAAAAKYVFARDLLHRHREEVGELQLLLHLELILCALLLPWSMMTGEGERLLRSHPSLTSWLKLCAAAGIGGFRFFVELLVLRYWSATTLSAANLSAHSLVIVFSIPIFDTPVTPFLVAGISVTLAASASYGWLKVSSTGGLEASGAGTGAAGTGAAGVGAPGGR